MQSSDGGISVDEATHADVVLALKCKGLQKDYLVARDSFIARQEVH